MPIEVSCDKCSKMLRVPDAHAGKQARCPHCQGVFRVPSGSGGGMPSQSNFGAPSKPTSSYPGSQAGGERWTLKTKDGSTYGPVPKSEMDSWVNEGRVTPDSQLLKDGAGQWQWAASVYPSIGSSGPAPGGGQNPFADQSNNPYSSPNTVGQGFRSVGGRYKQPHKGALILVFGLLSLFFCAILGPIAWVMGSQDLSAMSAGRMDDSGRGLTQAGMILGIVSTCLTALGIVLWVVIMCAAVVADA